MRRSPSCVSLKLASTQISSSERIGHQTLADLHIVAGIDVSARDDPIDLREDITVAEIEFGLVEIALGDRKLGLGLLDIRRVGREPERKSLLTSPSFSNASTM